MLFADDASDLLSRIPLSAGTILDVGCGTGSLLAAFRPINPNARLLGIDLDPAATAAAAAHMDHVVTGDVEADPLPFDVLGGIDCIIYNEVLEHLRDPWAVVRRHAEALGPNGMMLICVANIDHWRPVERLLRGSRHNGADNQTHPMRIQGFDLDAVRQHLLQAGLTLCDVTAREPDGDGAGRFAASIAPGLEGLGVDPEEYAKRAAPSHLIWRARKAPCQRLIVSGNMLAPVGGVSHVRVVYPLQAMATDPMVMSSVTNRVETGLPPDDMARVFVLHRPALVGEQGHELLRRLAGAGYLIVTEFDDLPDHFDMMRVGGALSFYGVHAVQTSTITMAAAMRQYNPEIAVFPNSIVSLPEVRNFADFRTLTMFFGALNREQEWVPLMPVINEIAALAGERLKFQVVHDQAFFDALETPHKTFTPTCDYDTYLRILGSSEISLMPLSDTPFNRAKSDLKFIEAAACRVASLASSVVYADSIEDGRTGLLFHDPPQLRACLLRLLTMPELARDIGDAARRYVARNRMLAYQVGPRIAWYRSLWAKRAALADLRAARMMRYANAG